MNMKEVNARLRLYAELAEAGIAHEDCLALRRISMTLHRWHELECGDSNDNGSWCIVRGYWRAGAFDYEDDGDAYMERHYHRSTDPKPHYHRVLDRERGALKRLAKIMSHYPELRSYVQGDPRGCALYILRADDIPEGATINSCHNRGIAVHK